LRFFGAALSSDNGYVFRIIGNLGKSVKEILWNEPKNIENINAEIEVFKIMQYGHAICF